ncbi:threonine dehydratase [Acuticoccus sp. M5D2P5]|uniref:threonine dehydratase n=1 Tax=Acuticoccus kalidii TaxID=2910977 RepID=UPI001F2EB638|nr:threonine dehydratase [Acuticoccus kalidii]MCF3932595.1 threonine dehydratase [Acuticoccus kalidii]
MKLETIESAARIIYRHMPQTPQFMWPQISSAVGANVWVKHENHTAIGAFKIRGSLSYMDWLKRTHPEVGGIVTATRGNHGQGQAMAAKAAGLVPRIYVPIGNSTEKNAAMRAFGGILIETGRDFDEARVAAQKDADQRGYAFVPPFHEAIVAGVATYALELMRAVSDLDTIYVSIGCGSGICGLIHVRNALGLKTKIVGVVSERADAVKRSVAAGRPMNTETADTFADGIATRVIMDDAFAIYKAGAERILTVSDEEIAAAMRLYFRATHNVAEGAGAAALAGLMKERDAMAGRNVGVILSGGNVDTAVFAEVLAGHTPRVGVAEAVALIS